MESIVQTLLPLILLIGIGSLLQLTIATEAWVEVLNKLAIYLLFPALIFSGMMKVELEQIDDFLFLYGNALLLVMIIVVLKFGLTKLGLAQKLVNTYVIAVFFGNVGYLGFPIITSLLEGSQGVVSMHVALYTLILFTLGIGILEFDTHQKIDKKIFIDTLKNPLLLAVIASVILLATDIRLPFVVQKTIDLLAGGATPIILISLGIFLIRPLPKGLNYKHLITLITLKLLIMPSIFYLYFYLGNQSSTLAISVLEAVMPVAITPFILAQLYPMERELIALAVVISSILSIITLSIWMVLVGVVA